MANHRATKKDVRKASKRRDSNRYYGKTTRNAIRDLKAIKEPKAAGEKMPEISSLIDRLAKKGVIHKNKAANLKSKLTRSVNKLAAVKLNKAKVKRKNILTVKVRILSILCYGDAFLLIYIFLLFSFLCHDTAYTSFRCRRDRGHFFQLSVRP